MSVTAQTSGGKGGQDGGEPEVELLSVEDGPGVNADLLDAARQEEKRSDGGDRVESLLEEVVRLRRELADARGAAEKATRRADVERQLTAAGAIDLEITTPLVEEVLGSMDEPEVARAVREVRASKGFLFRSASGSGVRSAAMAGEGGGGVGLEDLAGDARSSGDRSDLLRYLRARRG